MKKQTIFLSFFVFLTINICEGQIFFRTADLFPKMGRGSRSGELNIIQDLSVDTLLSRYVMANKVHEGEMEGFRIQIYNNSNVNAREESNKVRAEFMIAFPDIPSYAEFAPPRYFLIKVGDFRTKMEAAKSLYLIKKKYPNAYWVPCLINFPDLKKN
jgi:hypothetical protein